MQIIDLKRNTKRIMCYLYEHKNGKDIAYSIISNELNLPFEDVAEICGMLRSIGYVSSTVGTDCPVITDLGIFNLAQWPFQ